MARNRDLSKLLSTANGKITGSNLDVSFENISDTGTEGTKVASGTTAQRGSTTGQWRYNSTTGFFEGRNASTFSTLEPTPSVTSVDVGDVDSGAGGNQTFVITGTDFTTGGTIAFVGNDNSEFNADSTTFNSSTQVTAVKTKASFLNAKEPYKVRFTSSTGKIGISGSGLINVDSAPSWTTAAGNIGNVYEAKNANITVAASDAEGDTIAYTETGGTVLSTNGLSLNSASGLITGTAPAVSGDTTINFNLRATANSKNADRAFNILIKEELGSSANPATSAKQLYDAGYTSSGVYYFNNVFTGNQDKQAYARMDVIDSFNTNKLHLQRIDFGHLSNHAIRHYANSGTVSLTRQSGNATDSTVGAGSTYYYNASSGTGSGVSAMVDTGLKLTDFQGFTLVPELHQTSTGDGGNSVGVHFATDSSINGGNYGHNYDGDFQMWSTGSQSVDYFIQAIKFTNSSGSTIVERDDYLGGQWRDGNNADLWTDFYNQSGTNYNAGGSDVTINSTVSSNEYIGVRFRGWADHTSAKQAYLAFWIGVNGS